MAKCLLKELFYNYNEERRGEITVNVNGRVYRTVKGAVEESGKNRGLGPKKGPRDGDPNHKPPRHA